MAEHAYDEFDLVAQRPAAPVRAFGTVAPPGIVPADWDDLERYPELDFGPLRVRVPGEARVRMADSDTPVSDAVFLTFPHGQVRLSVLAAPRGARLWPDRAEEIATSQAAAGAQVRSVWGEWGRELAIDDDESSNWVIGVDGARWMLLARVSWPRGARADLVETMRIMIRTSVVLRGDEPLPVRAPLALRDPIAFQDEARSDEMLKASAAPYAGVVSLVPVRPGTAPDKVAAAEVTDVIPAQRREAPLRPVAVPPGPAGHRAAPWPTSDAPHPIPNEPDFALTGAAGHGGGRSHGGLLAAAALVLVLGVAGVLFAATRGPSPADSSAPLAAPSPAVAPNTGPAPEAGPDDTYPSAPESPQAGLPAPAGPGAPDTAPAGPGAPDTAPGNPTPAKRAPVPAKPIPAPVRSTPASSGSTAPVADAGPQSSAPDEAVPSRSTQASTDDDYVRGDRARGDSQGSRPHEDYGDESQGSIGPLSSDILRLQPGLN